MAAVMWWDINYINYPLYEMSKLIMNQWAQLHCHDCAGWWTEFCMMLSGIILHMGPANDRPRYNVMSSRIGWAHTQNVPCVMAEIFDDFMHHTHGKLLGNVYAEGSGVGVTKALFLNFSVSNFLELVKVPLRLFESHLNLTDATAAELRWHLSYINVLLNN